MRMQYEAKSTIAPRTPNPIDRPHLVFTYLTVDTSQPSL